MIRIIACLAIFYCIQAAVHATSDQVNVLELAREFTVAHAEKLIDQAHLNNRAKRSTNNADNEESLDYNYHGRQQFSENSIRINDFATTALKVSAKLLSSKSKPLQFKELATLKAPEKFCPFKEPVKCNPFFPYRTFDGSCNNEKNPWWGKSGSPFKRWTPPDYSDRFKLNEPRAASDGSELPNGRQLACALNGDFHDIEPSVSHLLMQWGQLVNHDVTSLSITREDDPDQSICKTCTKSHKCLPIMIESNTTCNCVKTMKHNCIEFTRSSASFGDVACTLGPREQINMQTSFLDGSHIYGASVAENTKLRDKIRGHGLLEVQQRSSNHNEDLLPASKQDRPSDCLDFKPTTKCFVAGDDRVNQNPSLMSMQTLFVREHNRIARILFQLNPTWSDEVLFQESRRLVIAQIQHITYNEYLPVVLGSETMKRFSLVPGKGFEKLNTYDPLVDPRIANEYSASAGRFGHSMVRTDYSRVNSEYKSAGMKSFLLRNSYFRANDLYDREEGGLESIVRGMLKDPLMKVDTWFSSELTQHLFETKNSKSQPFHFDLVAININRGRDHGIGSYTKFREFCNLEPVRSWNDMKRFIDNDVVDTYRQFFRKVEDVDLFLASIAEHKTGNALVGPTLQCLLGLQFQGLKFGDRFFYETKESPADFTFGQLMEIRKTSMSKLLCRNMNATPKIQPLAFISANEKGNELADCNTLPDIDWKFWKV